MTGDQSWQPIETAPKDGRTVFLKGPRGGKVRARFSMNAWGVCDWHVFQKGDMFAIGATHWRPK